MPGDFMSGELLQTIVLANWKAQLSPQRAAQWCETLLASYHPRQGVEVVLAVPFLFLQAVARQVNNVPGVSLAAQMVSPFPQGSYTGTVPAAWLRGLVTYVLVGHQERRRYFRETPQDVARQALECLTEELQPIVCVDRDTVAAQAAAFDYAQQDRLMWAYTPQDAVSLERSHGYATIAETIRSIKVRVGGQPVLYGGGVDSTNCRELTRLQSVAGVMMGRGCLDAEAFLRALESLG
ncbi:MAG: hypothetical protein CSA33_01445 [Desulfobulbus propionicus]|nr:MAG: hypothetical protein CSA33_01445 [Desulfobulbus propionicus]